MEDDLVERLRDAAFLYPDQPLFSEAADEIERLHYLALETGGLLDMTRDHEE